MPDRQRFDRITSDPRIVGGRACIRGLRITAAAVLDRLAAGASVDEVLADYPYLERKGINQALAYAASLAREDAAVPA